jgi:hypothetical protein
VTVGLRRYARLDVGEKGSRCGFTGYKEMRLGGHRAAKNAAAVIGLSVHSSASCQTSADMVRKQWREQCSAIRHNFPLLSDAVIENFVAVAYGSSWPLLPTPHRQRRLSGVLLPRRRSG